MDEHWLAKASQALAAAPAARRAGAFRPHDGKRSDLGLHLGDMLAEPDPDADPFLTQPRENMPQTTESP